MGQPRAKMALVAERRAKMLRMKNSGASIQEIAAFFEMSPHTASKDLSRAIRKARDLEVQEAELHRQINYMRLETLLKGVWDEAAAGDVKAGEQARKYIADIRGLLGIDIPVRTEISGPDGGAIPFSGGELSELTALIGISDQEHADIPAFDHDEDDDEDMEDDALDGEDEDGDDDSDG